MKKIKRCIDIKDTWLFSGTVRDNLRYSNPNATDEEVMHAADVAQAGDFIRSLPDGLDSYVAQGGTNFSGGQKQRVAIARALIHNRSILLVDEGTSALDQQNADIVEQSLTGNPDLTLILISHHLSEEGKKRFDKVYELKPIE